MQYLEHIISSFLIVGSTDFLTNNKALLIVALIQFYVMHTTTAVCVCVHAHLFYFCLVWMFIYLKM